MFLLKTIFAWMSVLIGMLGIVLLLNSAFLYFLAAGEEPKMKKSHGMLWGGLGCLFGAVGFYVLARML